jgi:hypothetical protein
VAAEHARARDAQIRLLRLQRAVLRAFIGSTDPEKLERMTDLTTLTADERRRVVDDYLDAIFGTEPSGGIGSTRAPVAARSRGALRRLGGFCRGRQVGVGRTGSVA